MAVVVITPTIDFEGVAFDDQIAILVTGEKYMDEGTPIHHIIQGPAFEVAKWIAHNHSYRQFDDADTASDLDEDVTSVQEMVDAINECNGDGCDYIQMTIMPAR